jgi:hypothetical protein
MATSFSGGRNQGRGTWREPTKLVAMIIYSYNILIVYCEITFIRGVPIFLVFMCKLIHEIKNPTNNETWEAV